MVARDGSACVKWYVKMGGDIYVCIAHVKMGDDIYVCMLIEKLYQNINIYIFIFSFQKAVVKL